MLVKQLLPASENFIPMISEREIQVLKFLCKEKTALEIADILKLSERTIQGYRENLFRKINAKSLIGLYKYAVLKGIYEEG